MSELVGPAYARKDYAGFIRRTAALALDTAIVYVVSVVVSIALLLRSIVLLLIVGYDVTEEQMDVLSERMGGFSVGLFIGGWVVYMLGFRLLPAGTPGYRIVGIRYEYMFSERPTILARLFRSVSAVALMLFFAFDHIWILFDEHKQAWHDKLAGFYVVKRKARPIGTQRVVRRVINFMAMTFFVWEPAGDAAHGVRASHHEKTGGSPRGLPPVR